MGRSRARFVAADLLLLLRHYKAIALDATPLGDSGCSSLIAHVTSTPHFSDCDTQTPSVVLVDRDFQTSLNKLRYDIGVQEDLFEPKVALFNDAYELSGWYISSISPFNFNDEEVVPWMTLDSQGVTEQGVWGTPPTYQRYYNAKAYVGVFFNPTSSTDPPKVKPVSVQGGESVAAPPATTRYGDQGEHTMDVKEAKR
ncbi:hypothetical protein CYMTET_38457 [Cymbomonas tetramitiformis]|uniref:Uncharacterized protein n=1 Tax=Cymbomonas tetramitiformis TaxID=36881 RepID=A0AAE0CDJ4_9CHLO|nr:hypothetical protein CYMTET_38457 [Cymbomonas tetramitiformis]